MYFNAIAAYRSLERYMAQVRGAKPGAPPRGYLGGIGSTKHQMVFWPNLMQVSFYPRWSMSAKG